MPGALRNMPNPNNQKTRNIDVVFVHDSTGSQQPYLNAATQESRNYVQAFADELSRKGAPGTARYRVIAFRDHREQGDLWTVNASNDFTDKPEQLRQQFSSLVAEGGGDGPEAQLDALDAALTSPWRLNARRVVFLITDSPPHGVEPGDEPPASHPSYLTTKYLVDNFKKQKIKLFVIGCIPTINKYRNAVSYYEKLVKDINAGGIYRTLSRPTTDTTPLRKLVVGSTLYASDVFHIEDRWEDWIADHADHGHDTIAHAMHTKLTTEGETCHEVDHGDHGIDYHKAPITRARVDDIVGRTLEARAARKADPIMSSIFGDDDDDS
ncbi:VWFA domain-containing protein [Mycena indigotica]|uniref:VWFA domain-containing protein n=1 Tax=Mycena indigotica TaxID=2126181 RepID=A0A8H6T853_9AGAR|nr:VWFA domain-containing protein [Mycena indigotica]KAF7312666.1 VWFA domain-containing protein [Mycena indigotica]